jgi:hypothetical protein
MTLHEWERPTKSLVGVERYVVKVKSNGVEFNPDKDATRGSFLDYPKATLCDFDGENFTIYNPALRELTAEEQNIMDTMPSKLPENAQQMENDMLTDGSTMFYRDNKHCQEAGMEYLRGHETIRGMRYSYNDKKVLDDNCRGTISMRYKILA